MAKSTPYKYFLLILCLGAANLPAQEPGIIPPPLPSVILPEPPDPETLPPPPQLEWAPLGPKGGEEEGGTLETVYVPPPQPEAFVALPPPPVEEIPLPGEPDPAELELAKPEVEIWRPEGESPQVPERRFNRLAQTYVTGTEPVWLRVQFDPLAVGKIVFVKPGRGMTLQPSEAVLTIPENGECLVLATLAEGQARSHVIFYCEGVKTVLPVVRAPLATVIAAEEGTGGSLQAAAAPTLRDPNEDPQGTAGALRSQIATGGSYSSYSGGGSRISKDLQMPGALGNGLDFTRYWNSVHNDYEDNDAEWSVDFGHSGWSHSWKWNAIYTGEVVEPEGGGQEVLSKMAITITFPDGHTTKYKIVRSSYPPADPRLGPDYTTAEINSGWPDGGMGVNDHLTKMAVNGAEFWLSLADGGSVHFVRITSPDANHAEYRATEVFDPHGLKTVLHYSTNDENGELERVEQEGGRQLKITWGLFNPGNWRVITQVETGGTAGFQRVMYKYMRYGHHLVLQKVTYENDPAPGQMTYARYSYGNCYGDEPEPCDGLEEASEFPLLKRADDPRYEGAMTKIRYNYRGGAPCVIPEPTPPWQPPLFVPAQPYAIAAEKSDTGVPVSRFQLNCENGERIETNGFDANRIFYFGSTANTSEGDFFCRGFQLGKVTDFYTGSPGDVPNQRQNFDFGNPRHIWDGRNIKTKTAYLDDSGSPSEVHHVEADGSSILYNRLDESGSETTLHPSMHNRNKRWLFWKKDENGNVTTYKRDSRRRVTQISYYQGPAHGNPIAVESYTYNDMNQVTTHTLPSGAVQTYVYNPLHQLVWEYNSINEEQKKYYYDGLGRVEKMRDTRAIADNAEYTEKMEYNGRHVITKIHYRATGGNGDPTVTYEYDNYGNRTAIIDELGHRKDFTYDSYRRCTSSIEQIGPGPGCSNGQVRRWDWVYDREVDGVAGLRPASSHTSSEWRVQVEPEFNDARERRASARTFDVNNRITSETTGLIQRPAPAAIGDWYSVAETETHYFTYDKNGQKETYKDPHERVTTYEYDPRNRLEKTIEPKRDNQPHPVTRFEYDVAGNKKKVTFPDTKTQEWLDFDPFGQPRQFKDERGNLTDFNYYPWGPMKKLSQVTTHRRKDNSNDWEHQATQFDYDLMGRPETTIFPDGSREVSTYELGQLKEFKTRRGQKKVIDGYDARGRETHHYWRKPPPYETEIDPATPAISRVWDDANRLTRIWNNVSIIDYSYDEAGQVRTEGTTVTGSTLREVRYCRYPNGEVARITYPNGSTVVNRFYTARGQLKGVGWGQNLSTSYVYHPDGTVNYQARENHVSTSYGYDGRGMIDWVKHRYATETEAYDLAKREYWRDDRDRIEAWKRGFDSVHNGMEDGRGNRYEYDDEGQLTKASYRAANPETSPGPAARADHFNYDELGNRKDWNTVASRGAMEFKRKNNGLNQYFSWANSYQPPQHWGTTTNYDDDVGGGWGAPGAANGVLMQDGWITAGFNALNQPIQMWSPRYPADPSALWMWFGYDPLGRCVKRWVAPVGSPPANPPVYFYYDGWNLIQEGGSEPAPERVYVHGGRVDEIVASWAGGMWSYHHYDAQGNCIMLTDTSGAIREQYDYDAFGWPYFYTATGAGATVGGKPGSPWGNRFLFTGREWISEMRLYDYRNRMYQPELGRFLQPDPIQFGAGDYNLYRYCHNDPVNKNDPTGLYSALTMFGGGDWIKGSDGLSAWDRDHGMPSNRPQAGMDGAGGGASNGGYAPSKSPTANRFVPKLAKDKVTAIPVSRTHSNATYEHQFKTFDGKRISGVGHTVLEHLETKGKKVGDKQTVEKPLRNNGIFPDRVGLDFRPSRGGTTYSESLQTFEVKYNGRPVEVSTVLKQKIEETNGEVKVTVTVVTP